MAWAIDLANEFKKRDNKKTLSWFEGKVVSPVRNEDLQTGKVTFSGPLKISCFGGEVMLSYNHLRQLGTMERVYAGQSVALLGNPFLGTLAARSF